MTAITAPSKGPATAKLILSKSTLGLPRRRLQEQIQMITSASGMLTAMALPIIDATAKSKFPW
jgi:hypothetical protein